MENQTQAVAHHKGVNAALIFAGTTAGIYFIIKIAQIVISLLAVKEIVV